MLWWDTRKLEEPIDSLVLSTDAKGGEGVTLGGSSLGKCPRLCVSLLRNALAPPLY